MLTCACDAGLSIGERVRMQGANISTRRMHPPEARPPAPCHAMPTIPICSPSFPPGFLRVCPIHPHKRHGLESGIMGAVAARKLLPPPVAAVARRPCASKRIALKRARMLQHRAQLQQGGAMDDLELARRRPPCLCLLRVTPPSEQFYGLGQGVRQYNVANATAIAVPASNTT